MVWLFSLRLNHLGIVIRVGNLCNSLPSCRRDLLRDLLSNFKGCLLPNAFCVSLGTQFYPSLSFLTAFSLLLSFSTRPFLACINKRFSFNVTKSVEVFGARFLFLSRTEINVKLLCK